MEIKKNKNGQMFISNITNTDTVSDYLDTLNTFLTSHPLKCSSCSDNCCQQNWNLQLDIVFFNRLVTNNPTSSAKTTAEKFIKLNPLKKPVFRMFPCKFLNENGRCSIYKRRAFTCRVYTCKNETKKYSQFKDTLIQALNVALAVKLTLIFKKTTLKKAGTIYNLKNSEDLPLNNQTYDINIFQLLKACEGYLPQNKIKKL